METSTAADTAAEVDTCAAEPVSAHTAADEPVDDAALAAAEAHEVEAGHQRRLDTIRTAILVVAGLGIVSVVAPWWKIQLPEQQMNVLVDGRTKWIRLEAATHTITGLTGGQLTRTMLVACGAAAIWWAFGKGWWWSVPLVLWTANPMMTVGPPKTAPASVVGDHSQMLDVTVDMWGISLNRILFWGLLCLVVAGGVQTFRLRSAQRAVDRSEGRPAGLWEKTIAPRLAAAGITINVGNDTKAGSSSH